MEEAIKEAKALKRVTAVTKQWSDIRRSRKVAIDLDQQKGLVRWQYLGHNNLQEIKSFALQFAQSLEEIHPIYNDS